MKKNDRIRLFITDIGTDGEGIGRYEGYAFFVKDAVIGDEVEAVITKMNKNYGFAKTLKVITPSQFRTSPPCPNAGRCGGCQIMQMDYGRQLAYKESKVRNNLERIGSLKNPPLKPVIGMEEAVPLHFRNKVQFPVGTDPEGNAVTGFYAGRTHYIVGTDSCPVSAEITDRILKAVRDFVNEQDLPVYDEKTGKGLLRHILIRTGTYTGQVMVCLVINGDSLSGKEDLLVSALKDAFPEITSICLNSNKQNTNVILGNQVICLYGEDHIEDRIGDLTFRISPLSFYQVNPIQTEKLYKKALEYASLTGEETVWDLYCGIGTISLFLARQAKQVYGVEIIPAAISNAEDNASLNHISNARFFCGASEKIFPEMMSNNNMRADVVVLDPPRKGCDKALLDAILEQEPDRIVYVSCDSATLARDIKILGSKYELTEATPVDMFPHTVHVECVALLSNRNADKKGYITLDVNLDDYYRIKNDGSIKD